MSTSAVSPAPGTTIDTERAALVAEIRDFLALCERRFTFNNRWDVALTAGGILLGIGVVAAGAFQAPRLTTILGAVITAAVSAQRAFPFSQRAQFYRSLIGQTTNLQTDLGLGLLAIPSAVATLKSLRLDFAQQLPRGSSATPGSDSAAGQPQPQPGPGQQPAAAATAAGGTT